ncbi:hypothetical protein QQ045_008203 [Rhodiola kirilowii]
MASSSKLSNGTVTRLFSVAKDEKAGDPKPAWYLKEALKMAVGKADMSKWRKVNSVACGIEKSMIPLPSRIVLKVLRDKGHQCFLVGGCVRDLLLKRVPKDFDVITTANLKQIKNHFHRSQIVGQRFPVCVVNIRGQEIEVSSFDTVANAGSVDKSSPRLMPKNCTKTDVLLWRNSMLRDFTVNSLFFDPYSARIYDYTGGMIDLKSLELRTLVPAHLSFQEDCARILRGLRIAARLNLSVSHDTASAIHHLSSSVLTLSKFRIMMELNYMLSYGAAQPSLSLLERFNLLQVFFPCHAAILDQQKKNGFSLSSAMLMRLFSNLDNMVACDRPAHSSLWISLLAFHLALNTKPQEPLVIWTLSLLLCTKNWSKSVESARESAQRQKYFSAPEIFESLDYMDDVELANKVSELASLVTTSIRSLTNEHALLESISRFRKPPSSVLVFVPERCGKDTAKLFSMFDADIKSYTTSKKKADIDYQSLKTGEVLETRYVLGQVIMDTMSGKVKTHKEEMVDHNRHLHPSVHAIQKVTSENKRFTDVWPEPFEKLSEGFKIKNSDTVQQDLDAYFLEELGPASFQETSKELISVARTCPQGDIPKQKLSEILDHRTEDLSKKEACQSRKTTTNEIVQPKMVNVKQVVETLQLLTEIKFSNENLKKDNQTASKMFQSREEALSKEKGDAKQAVNETNSRKPLSSLFKITTMEHNTSSKQNMSEKLQHETQSLTLGKKHHKAMKKQEVMVKLSQLIREPLKEKNCVHEAHTNEVEEAIDGDNDQPSVCVTGQKTATMKRKLIKTQSKSQVKTRNGLINKNRETSVVNVDVDIQDALVGTNCRTTEDDMESLKTDQRKMIINEEITGAHTENMEESTETTNANLHHPTADHILYQKTATKKKSSKMQSEQKQEMKTGLWIKNKEAPKPDIDDDITGELRELRFNEGDEDLAETTKAANKPKKCCKAAQKQKTISSEEFNEASHNEKIGARTTSKVEVVGNDNGCSLPSDQVQDQTNIIKKRKPRKTLSKKIDEMSVQPASNETMQLKTAMEVTDYDLPAHTTSKVEVVGNDNGCSLPSDEVQDQTYIIKKRKPRKTRSKKIDEMSVQPASNETMQLKTAMEVTDYDLPARTTSKVEVVGNDNGCSLPSDQVQDQTNIIKKRKPRKTRSKKIDVMSVQPASNETMQLKTAMEVTGDDVQAAINKTRPGSI